MVGKSPGGGNGSLLSILVWGELQSWGWKESDLTGACTHLIDPVLYVIAQSTDFGFAHTFYNFIAPLASGLSIFLQCFIYFSVDIFLPLVDIIRVKAVFPGKFVLKSYFLNIVRQGFYCLYDFWWLLLSHYEYNYNTIPEKVHMKQREF